MNLRRRLKEVAFAWFLIFLGGWLLHKGFDTCSPSPNDASAAEAKVEESISSAQASVLDEIAREEVRVAATSTQELISPLVALQNYAIDMRNTPEEGLPQWLGNTGHILNATEFQKAYFPRWGVPLEKRFPEKASAPHSLYQFWIERSEELKLDLFTPLLVLVRTEVRLDILKHWLNLLMHHRSPAELRRSIAELRSYLEQTDRTAPEFPQRAKEILTTLILLGALDNSLKEEIVSILMDSKIGTVVGDAAGFSSLTMLAATMPYSALAHRIPDLLKSNSKEVQWGVVEMLRFYVHQSQLNGEAMAGMIPDVLIRSADDTRSAAALELLASYGGQNGRERLMSVVRDVNSPRRGAALGFLAAANKLQIQEVLEFASDPNMAMAVLGSLASLGSRGSTQAYSEIERFLMSRNADVQREAATILFRIGRLSNDDAQRYGVQ
jgi:hypothetical protein